MVNSFMSKTAIKKELQRLQMVKAGLVAELMAFAFGGIPSGSISEIEEELFFIEIQIKDASKRL